MTQSGQANMCGYKRRRQVSKVLAFTDRDLQNLQGCAVVLESVTMKLLLLALSVTLLFAAGKALNCHRCVPASAGEDCELTVETCKPGKDGCAAAKFRREPYGHYQKCMAMADCQMLQLNNFIRMKCCDSDMCNTFDE